MASKTLTTDDYRTAWRVLSDMFERIPTSPPLGEEPYTGSPEQLEETRLSVSSICLRSNIRALVRHIRWTIAVDEGTSPPADIDPHSIVPLEPRGGVGARPLQLVR